MKIKTAEDYINFILASTSMPVLMKLKPACLVNFQKSRFENRAQFLKYMSFVQEQYKIEYLLLYEAGQQYFIFFYHVDAFSKIIKEYETQNFLKDYGYYPGIKTGEYLEIFKSRYRQYQNKNRAFPDELGIFLGYPLEDVIAYIENGGRKYLLCGYWKVYKNVAEAKQTFYKYKEMQKKALQTLNEGVPLKSIIN